MPSREGSRVFLGNLPDDVRERDIEKFFDRYGRVRNIFIKNGRYGFCEFDDYRDADDAVYDLNGKELLGVRITVEHAKGLRRDGGRDGGRDNYRDGGRDRDRRGRWVEKYGPPTRTDYRVIVENLSSRVSWQDLKDLMRRAGEVTFANAHNDRKNEGIVEFATKKDMERAIEKYDGYELQGRRLQVQKDRATKSRSRSRSRSRGRERSRRSRSRSHSRDRSRSKSRDRSRSKSGDRSRSKSRDRSRSKSRDRSRSNSRDRSRSGERDSSPRSRKRSMSRSRSRSAEDDPRAKHARHSDGEENGYENGDDY